MNIYQISLPYKECVNSFKIDGNKKIGLTEIISNMVDILLSNVTQKSHLRKGYGMTRQ